MRDDARQYTRQALATQLQQEHPRAFAVRRLPTLRVWLHVGTMHERSYAVIAIMGRN